MLAKLNPLNWFSSESETETDYQARPARAGVSNSLANGGYKHELSDKSRIKDPQSLLDASEYGYAGVHTISKPLYGYKATNEGIVRLIIPSGAKVVSPNSPAPLGRKKLRAGEVYVDKIVCCRGPSRLIKCNSDTSMRNWYEYEVGKLQIPEGGVLSESVSRQCAPGLHFFIMAGQAIEYYVRNGNGAKIPKTEAINAIKPDR